MKEIRQTFEERTLHGSNYVTPETFGGNFMKTYHIKHTSRLISFCLMMMLTLSILIGGVAFFKNILVNDSIWIALIVIIPLCFLSVRLSMKIATITVEFKMDMDKLTIKSGVQAKFHERLNYEIELRQIESYLYEKPNAHFDKFILTMKNKEVIKFFHNTDFDDTDDFFLFLNDFKATVTSVNAIGVQTDSSFKPIQKQPSIYERPLGKLYAIGAVIIVVVVPTLMLWNRNNDFSGYGPMIVSLGWALFYLAEFYITKRKSSR